VRDESFKSKEGLVEAWSSEDSGADRELGTHDSKPVLAMRETAMDGGFPVHMK
jgi:hypothetical protein